MDDRDQFIGRDGVRLRFRDEGSGPAVLLIHGWSLDMDMWEPQFPALAARYRVVAFDRRGFGQSTGQPDVAGDVHDVQYLLGTMQVERAAIVGMSQGARVALRFALKFPNAVSCLVLDGPPREDTLQDDDAAEEVPMATYRELVQRRGIEAFRQVWARHPFMLLQTSNARTRALLGRIIGRYPGRDLLSAGPEYPAITSSPQSLRAPTLVINGECDSQRRRAAGAAMTRWLPEARRAIVPGAGHLPNLDNPTAYNELLAGFLRAHTAVRYNASPTP